MKVLIAVTHLLGAGHLTRAAALARGFAGAGHRVILVSGGMPAAHIALDGLEVVQLPPVRSDGTDFTRLLTPDGPADADYLARRGVAMEEAARTLAPDVVITELFPFGRRILAAEFRALIAAARQANPAVRVLCSIRDILAPPSSQKKADRTAALLAELYDAVLVHSDPAIVPLSLSWPITPEVEAKLRYTGFVVAGAETPAPQARGREVLVSAGGGSVGRPVFEAAIAAARLAPDLDWRLLVGGADAEQVCAALAQDAPANLRVEPARPDFRTLLARAGASVSLAGYNTAMDLILTGVPAVLVPFDAGSETEQGLRAEGLAQLPGVTVLRAAEVTPAALVASVRHVMADTARPRGGFALDGVGESLRIVTQMGETS